MDNRIVQEKKAWIHGIIKSMAEAEKKKFLAEVTHNTGLTPEEITKQFDIHETRLVQDIGVEGNLYNTSSKIVLTRKK